MSKDHPDASPSSSLMLPLSGGFSVTAETRGDVVSIHEKLRSSRALEEGVKDTLRWQQSLIDVLLGEVNRLTRENERLNELLRQK